MAKMAVTGNAFGMQPDQGDDSTQGGGMLKRMVAKHGPAAGKKEFFSTLQKQGRIKRGATTKKLGSGKSGF
jgi:hypothetical protein